MPINITRFFDENDSCFNVCSAFICRLLCVRKSRLKLLTLLQKREKAADT